MTAADQFPFLNSSRLRDVVEQVPPEQRGAALRSGGAASAAHLDRLEAESDGVLTGLSWHALCGHMERLAARMGLDVVVAASPGEPARLAMVQPGGEEAAKWIGDALRLAAGTTHRRRNTLSNALYAAAHDIATHPEPTGMTEEIVTALRMLGSGLTLGMGEHERDALIRHLRAVGTPYRDEDER